MSEAEKRRNGETENGKGQRDSPIPRFPDSPIPVPVHTQSPIPLRLIVNPVSGKGRGLAVAEQVSRLLRSYGLANDVRVMHPNMSVLEAALEAGKTRLRPVLMTALAMIIGMVPMAIGLGEGSEQNAPLGRAVIGGLIFATVSTVLFVPVLFATFHERLAARKLNKELTT